MVQGLQQQQTSTPRGDCPPPALQTPSTVPRSYYSSQQVVSYHQSVDTSDVEPDYVAPMDHGDESPYWTQGGDGQEFGYDEQGDMAETDFNYHNPVTVGPQNMGVYHPNQFLAGYPPQGFPMAYVTSSVYQSHQGIYHEGAYNLIHEAPVGGFRPAPYPSLTPTLPVNRDDFRSEVEATFTEGELELVASSEAKSMERSGLRSPMKLSTLQTTGRDGGMDGYKVRFADPRLSGGSDGEPGRQGRGKDALEAGEPRSVEEEEESGNAQENFLRQGVYGWVMSG